MFVISPLSNCGSPQKRDRFLEYLSKIAPVTLQDEPACKAYAWFRSAEDNDTVPHHWLRGLEVYDTIEANTVSHRSSAPYKAFRTAVAEENLLDRPSDLRFWRPTGVGFLAKPGPVNFMEKGSSNLQPSYAIVHDLSPKPGLKGEALESLHDLAQLATDAKARSYAIHDRGKNEEDESLLVFILFGSKVEAAAFEKGLAKGMFQALGDLCEVFRRTTWVECGVGFIGRD